MMRRHMRMMLLALAVVALHGCGGGADVELLTEAGAQPSANQVPASAVNSSGSVMDPVAVAADDSRNGAATDAGAGATVDSAQHAGVPGGDEVRGNGRGAESGDGVLSADAIRADGGMPFTYWDGDEEITVWLVPQFESPGSESPQGAAGRDGAPPGSRTEAESGDEGLMFTTESGEQLFLGSRVVLVLDAAWSAEQVQAFFDDHGIDAAAVSELGWLENGFLIETEPGLAALELANSLVGLTGVELSTPDWQAEAELR